MSWVRSCPSCGGEQKYTTKKGLKNGLKKNSKCYICSNANKLRGFCKNNPWNKGLIAETDSRVMDIRKRQMGTGNSFWGKHHSSDTINKLRIINTGRKHTQETKDKLSKMKLLNHPRRDKSWTEYYGEELGNLLKNKFQEGAKKFRNSPAGELHRLKFIDMLKNNNPSKNPEVKRKQRLAAIKRKLKQNNGWHPNYSPDACKMIDEYNEKHDYHFQHALNGGEIHLEELGFYPGGYDKERNAVIEIYEKFHRYQKGHDENRKQEIMNYLGCKFIILEKKENGYEEHIYNYSNKK